MMIKIFYNYKIIEFLHMDKDMLTSLYHYFSSTLESSLGYSNTLSFPTFKSDNLIHFDYLSVGDYPLDVILISNPDIVKDIKAVLIAFFSNYYENLESVNLVLTD